MTYKGIISQIDATVNPVHVECHMRLEYGTLDHLPREKFREEIVIFRACEAEMPGYGAKLAESYGLQCPPAEWAVYRCDRLTPGSPLPRNEVVVEGGFASPGAAKDRADALARDARRRRDRRYSYTVGEQ